jgi:hypothetical protein
MAPYKNMSDQVKANQRYRKRRKQELLNLQQKLKELEDAVVHR